MRKMLAMIAVLTMAQAAPDLPLQRPSTTASPPGASRHGLPWVHPAIIDRRAAAECRHLPSGNDRIAYRISD